MDDVKPARARLTAEQLRPLLPAVALLCLVLAAWFAWSAWQRFGDESRRSAVQAARDDAALAARLAITTEKRRIETQLARADVQLALATGDLAAAGAALTQGWPAASGAAVYPPDLDGAYAALQGANAAPGAYGRLATLEAALADNAPTVGLVRDGAASRMAIAAPARVGERLVGVAFVQLPIERIAANLKSASIPSDSYLALRQGSASVVETGDTALAGGAEALSSRIDGSDLRVAAAVPDVAGGPLGMNAMGSAITSLVLLMLALVAWKGPRIAIGRKRADAEVGDEMTLREVIGIHEQRAAAAPASAASERPVDAVAPPDALAATLDHGIFRAYDIRGIVGQSLDAKVAERIGQAIGTVMHERGLRDVVVGRDGRLSGPALSDGLIEGLRLAGCDVVDIGLAPTPLVYFGAYHLNAGSCVSVTGSHNPPDYNGFKVVVGGETLSGEAITDLYERIVADRLHRAPTPGGHAERDISEDYVQRVASDVQLDQPLKVVVDAGNGVAGDLGPRVLEAIGADVIPLYCDIDGTFPNHHPDPSEPHNLKDLIESVQRLGADLGVAFDGDGDRLGVVTRDGQSIYPDRLLMLFAADVLERNPGAMVIFDVKCTGRLPGHILRHGGSPLMWKTGHSLIKAKMRETDAELAGEMSGHFFFKERWYGFDDGIYSAARLLEILAAQPRSASETLNALPNGVSTPEIKVDAPNGNPHAFVERFRDAASFEGARLSTIDGLRVDYPDGWGLVRASNTTPVLVMRFDADSADALARIQAAFREQLLALEPSLPLRF